MISRFSQYPGGKILGFGAATHMQKSNIIIDNQALGLCLNIPVEKTVLFSLAFYIAYKSYAYLHSKCPLANKDKKDDKNCDSNEKSVSEELKSMRRPGM